MQLRDNNPLTEFPGQWGLFRGMIEPGESTREAAYRELKEEICYTPSNIIEVTQYLRGNSHINVCFAEVRSPLSALELHEGFDFGFFSRQEIFSGSLFLKKLMFSCPVAQPVLGFFHDYLHWAQTSKVSLQ